MIDMGCKIMGMSLFVDENIPADEVRIMRAKRVLATAFGLLIPKQEVNRMSDPTGNALRSAQSSGGEFFEDIDACAESPEMEERSILSVTVEFANRLRTESRAREARLLALVEEWQKSAADWQKKSVHAEEQNMPIARHAAWAAGNTQSDCAKDLLAALRGDA